MRTLVRALFTGTVSYSTVRSATIESKLVGIVYRIAQLLILSYVIGYDIIWNKGYQKTDIVTSTISTKVKGLGYIDFRKGGQSCDQLRNSKGYRIFDTPDYVIPPNEYNSVFIMTNYIDTIQKQGFCDAKLDIHVNSNIKLDNFYRRNVQRDANTSYLSNCKYHPKTDPYCPIYEVGDILKDCENDKAEIELMLKKGGIIEIGFTWNCNYDVLFDKPCIPKVQFRRFDSPFKDRLASSGFNFRFANRYMINDTEYRILYKAFGLRFIISVNGQAGRFSIIPLMISIGAGLSLMSLSVLIADCVLLNFTNKKKIYQKLKELDAKEHLKNNDILPTTRK